MRGRRVRVADAFAGVRFALVEDVRRSTADRVWQRATTGAPRVGRSWPSRRPAARRRHALLASADRRQFAVRILGATGRVRIFEFDARDGALGAAMRRRPERRAARRWMPRTCPGRSAARGAGHEVAIVNLSAVGMLIEVAAPLPPGRAVTVHLVRSSRGVALAGAVARCRGLGHARRRRPLPRGASRFPAGSSRSGNWIPWVARTDGPGADMLGRADGNPFPEAWKVLPPRAMSGSRMDQTMASNFGIRDTPAWSEQAQGGLMQDGVLRETGRGSGHGARSRRGDARRVRRRAGHGRRAGDARALREGACAITSG